MNKKFLAELEDIQNAGMSEASEWIYENQPMLLKMAKVIEAADNWIAGGAKGLPIKYFMARGELEE